MSACEDGIDSDSSAKAVSADQPASVSQATAEGVASEADQGAALKRWYTAERVERGAVVFADHCASCHGEGAEGTFDWRRRDANGNFPPPPLNGSAHAWHHPINVLGSQIKFGAPGGQGTMPAFGDKLSDEDIIDAIAWFQDKWPDEIYATWLDIELRSRSSSQ